MCHGLMAHVDLNLMLSSYLGAFTQKVKVLIERSGSACHSSSS
jgi:hypothetical protein